MDSRKYNQTEKNLHKWLNKKNAALVVASKFGI